VSRIPRRRGYDPFLPLLLFLPSLLLLLLVFRRAQRRGGRAMARVERDAAAAVQALVLVGVGHGLVVPWWGDGRREDMGERAVMSHGEWHMGDGTMERASGKRGKGGRTIEGWR
jgi:hypothetical protein